MNRILRKFDEVLGYFSEAFGAILVILISEILRTLGDRAEFLPKAAQN